jgi:hypothetical protein
MFTNPSTSILFHAIFRDGLALSSGTRSAPREATCWDDDERGDEGSDLVKECWGGGSSAHDG